MILEGAGLQLLKIGSGQRKLKGVQPWKACAVVWQYVSILKEAVPPPPPAIWREGLCELGRLVVSLRQGQLC